MKKFLLMASCALLLLATSCEKEQSNILIGDQPEPSWSVPSDYDMTSSMTAIVKVDLAQTYPTQVNDSIGVIDQADILAAFVGDECVGNTSPIDGGLFFLYVTGLSSTAENAQVTLKYYSSTLKNTFVAADAFPFRNDDKIGSVSSPLAPMFWLENVKK